MNETRIDVIYRMNAELSALRDQAESREEDVRSLNEIVSRLDTELATLRKALEDRRTVEGWCAEHGCRLELEFNEDSKRTVYLSIASGELEFSGEYPSIDEAFAAAAEWVRWR